MDLEAKLDAIPRGNTCPGVNRAIIEFLLEGNKDLRGEAVLDAPCGRGEFLDVLKTFFPECRTYGADIVLPKENGDHVLIQADLADEKLLTFAEKFSLITSISGVMEFDNTLNYFRKICERMAESGLLIVSNDNLMSAKDRCLYFFTGRFRQYPTFVEDDAPTWKILPLQNLLRILHDGGFKAEAIRYVPAKWTEWFWLPVALPIYLTQTLSIAFSKKGLPYNKKTKRYPFVSLFSRHYLVICRPRRSA